ncbi:hypothetical protein Tco_0975329 [Tanacetum coccineum]|uniref:Tf2-1-like SH3-like domain-containing protein n=1 Tax=Tanacetum coccineum TaxID=301880 RepID=A0ABQ5EED7_9ASTR
MIGTRPLLHNKTQDKQALKFKDQSHKRDLNESSKIKVRDSLKSLSLPTTSSGHDAIWVIVDRHIKSAHFLAVSKEYKMERFGRFVGPFEIVERVGPVAYRLRLPQEIVGIHDTFHVSNLKKCLADVNLHVPLEEIKIDNELHFVEESIEIMDREVKKLNQSRFPIVKVRWNSRRGPEFTWEQEDEMKRKYPQLFASATA